jgi:hypothetical protein
MTMLASMKRKKGNKKEAAAAPDLSRIMGYTPPNDVPAESDRCGAALPIAVVACITGGRCPQQSMVE